MPSVSVLKKGGGGKFLGFKKKMPNAQIGAVTTTAKPGTTVTKFTEAYKPKPQITGVKMTQKSQGGPSKPTTSVDLGFKRGPVKTTYTKARAFTGHKAYGKDNPNAPEKPEVVQAQNRRQDFAYDKKGLKYRAGYTTQTKEPDKFTTKIDVKPNIQKRDVKVSYMSKPTALSGGKLKARALTKGGSKGEHPATKHGVGSSRGSKAKFKQTKIKVHKKGY